MNKLAARETKKADSEYLRSVVVELLAKII